MAKTPEFDFRDNVSKNHIINGDMRISQRNTSFAAVANGAYTLDRYITIKNTSAVHTISQDSDVPTFAQAGYVFQKSLRMNLTTPDDTIGSGDVHYLEQRVEGYNFANLAQKPFTLSFWVKATLAGNYAVAFRNSTPDRSYVAQYNIAASNTWQKITINVAASPSAGTWNYDNGIGLRVAWMLASGSTNNTTPGSWQTGNFTGTSSIVNGVATGATDFRITGVMLNEGNEAAEFRPSSNGDITQELLLCQRYYEKSYSFGAFTGNSEGTTAIFIRPVNTRLHIGPIKFRTRKRGSPTATFWNHRGNLSQNFVSVYNADSNVAVVTGNVLTSETGFAGYLDANPTVMSDDYWGVQWTADSEL